MFSIYDGRAKFYQWDKDRKLIVEDETIAQVHFANCLCENARVCEVKDGLVDVPNELLTETYDVRVWGYDGFMTKHSTIFEVEKRTKPADYIYTQTECWTVDKAVEEALEDLDLSEYVKKTDIATYSTPGLVKPASWYGIIIDSAGTLNLVNTQEAHINNRGNNGGQVVAVTTTMLDYAVKQALTNPLNTTWTDEEKAAARALLGIE